MISATASASDFGHAAANRVVQTSTLNITVCPSIFFSVGKLANYDPTTTITDNKITSIENKSWSLRLLIFYMRSLLC